MVYQIEVTSLEKGQIIYLYKKVQQNKKQEFCRSFRSHNTLYNAILHSETYFNKLQKKQKILTEGLALK